MVKIVKKLVENVFNVLIQSSSQSHILNITLVQNIPKKLLDCLLIIQDINLKNTVFRIDVSKFAQGGLTSSSIDSTQTTSFVIQPVRNYLRGFL